MSLEIAGRLLLGDELVPGLVIIDEDRIVEVRREEGVTGPIVAPGYIDLQVNGGFGVEVGEDPDALRVLARRLPETGVTSFLPTVITSPSDFYPHLAEMMSETWDVDGAAPLGLHLEGPFLSPRRAGAHRVDLIEAADRAILDHLEFVELVTLAADRPDAADLITQLRRRGIAVSLGHTDATYEQFEAGVDAGAIMATHLYNAMSPFQHRAPGAIGAALLDDRITAALIPDGIHSHPASLRLAYRAKGPDRLLLVTDMVAAAGMPQGEYELGGRRVVSDGRSVRLPDGTLAGSALTMDAAVRNMARWSGATVPQVLGMAAGIPARVLCVSSMAPGDTDMPDIGCIRQGSRADLVLLDDALEVQATMVAGKWVFAREE